MNYFELAKAITRAEWGSYGDLRTSQEPGLRQTHLSLLLRALRPDIPRVSGDAGVSLLLRRL